MQIRRLVVLISMLCISVPALSGDPAQKLYLSASKAERDGDAAKASSLYEEILRRFPDSPLAIKASDKLTARKEAETSVAEQEAEAQARAQEATSLAERIEKQEAEAKMQQWIQRCMSENNLCKQACISQYGGYSAYQATACQMDCNNRRNCNPYTTGKVDCFRRDADKMRPACWGT